LPSGIRGLLLCGGNHRWNDPAVGSQAEEFFAAGIAPVCGEAEKPLHGDPRAAARAVARNVLEIEVPAPRAVSVSGEGDCHAPGVKPQVTGVAPPRSQSGERAQKIENAVAVRTVTVRTPALGTNHFSAKPPLSAR